MPTYYVDATTGSDSDTGLTEELAWETINKVNISNFSPNDSILFKKGEVWRERLTPPDSGSDGSPITFGAYGSGADPIVSGSDIITGFSGAWGGSVGTPTTDADAATVFDWSHTITAGSNRVLVVTVASEHSSSTVSTVTCDSTALDLAKRQQEGDNDAEIWYLLETDFPSDGPNDIEVTFDGASNAVCAAVQLDDIVQEAPIVAGSSDTSTDVVSTNITTAATNSLVIDSLSVGENKTVTPTAPQNELYDVQWSTMTGASSEKEVASAGVTAMEQTVSSSTNRLAHAVASFSPIASTVYSKGSITTEPLQVFSDDVKLTENDGATTGVGSGEWDWASDTLYVNTGEDISGNVIEAGQRSQGALVFQVDYIDIDGIQFQHGNTHGIQSQEAEYCNYKNVLSTYNKVDGIFVASSSGNESTDTLIQDCEMSYNGYNGVEVSSYTHSVTVDGVSAHDNAIDPTDAFAAGIYLAKNPAHAGSTWTGHIVEGCTIYDNGTDGEIAGIWFDEVDDGGGHHIRRNHCYGNTGPGIWVEAVDSGLSVYYNVCRDNTGSDGSDAGIGIRVGWGNTGVTVYNNVMYGNRINLLTGGYVGSSTPTFTNNIFKNNTTLAAVTTEFAARFGGENDGSYGSGNVYTYNCFGAEASNFVEWGNGVYKSTYDAWETAYGSGTNSVEADPLFVNAGGAAAIDYALASGSPCIDAGVAVGLTQDYSGGVVVGLTDIGAFEDGTDTYYVDQTSGSDSDPGSLAEPWETVSKVNGLSINPGTSILFKRGEVWREQLMPPSDGSDGSPITFGAFGSGDDPVISGFNLVSPWTAVTASGSGNANPTLSYGLTVANNPNRMLIVGVSIEASGVTCSGVTFDDVAMTEVDRQLYESNNNEVSMFYLEAPSATTANVVVTVTGGTGAVVSGATSLYNVKQQAPEADNTNSGSGETHSANITTITNGAWIVDAVSNQYTGQDMTPDSAQTERWEEFLGHRGNGSTKPFASAGPTSMSWTSTGTTAWGIVVAAFAPEAGETIAYDNPAVIFYNDSVDPVSDWPDDRVANVLVDTNEILSWSADADLSSGEFYHDDVADTLYVRMSDDSDPSGHTIEAAWRQACVRVEEQHWIIIQDLHTRGGVIGIQLTSTGDTNGCTNCIIRRNRCEHGGEHAIKLTYSTDSEVHDNICEYFDWSGIDGWAGTGIHLDAGGDGGAVGSDDNSVHDNIVRYAQDDGVLIRDSDNVTFYNNLITDVGTGLHGVWVKDSDGFNAYYNVVECGPQGNCFQIEDASLTAELYNNVVVLAHDKHGIRFTENSTGGKVKNNASIATWDANARCRSLRVDSGSETSFTANNNCWYHATGDIVHWLGTDYNASEFGTYQTVSSQEADSITDNPLFVNASSGVASGYALTGDSPCIDEGTDVSLTTDYRNRPVPYGDAQDIGAFEYSPAGGAISIMLYGAPGIGG